jgi:hypothetical protein
MSTDTGREPHRPLFVDWPNRSGIVSGMMDMVDRWRSSVAHAALRFSASGLIPDPNEWHLIADSNFDVDCDPLRLVGMFVLAWRCPSCGRNRCPRSLLSSTIASMRVAPRALNLFSAATRSAVPAPCLLQPGRTASR